MFQFAFVPLQALSTRGDEIHDAIRNKIEQNASTYPPGLLEQYKIQLDRLSSGSPGCELISFPGFLSFPNPPTPNTKYITMLFALNHNFSRGTIVSQITTIVSSNLTDILVFQHCTSDQAKDDPAFDPCYFSEDVGAYARSSPLACSLNLRLDLQTFVEIAKFARKLADTEPLKVT
jgi:hypothetical protein